MCEQEQSESKMSAFISFRRLYSFVEIKIIILAIVDYSLVWPVTFKGWNQNTF